MRRNKARFVTACQQSLALGAVLAVLAPAANVVSLDVVGTLPGSSDSPVTTGSDGAADRSSDSTPGGTVDRAPAADPGVSAADREPARVETEPVQPVVHEVPMEAVPDQPDDPAKHELVSDPEKVTGYGAVGVTWQHGEELKDDQITVLVRTRTDGTWSSWTAVQYHEEHGPDPDSDEGRHARPGTDPLLVGEVDEVQAKAVTTYGSIPDDVTLSVIQPGASKDTEVEEPAIDTSRLDTAKRDQTSEQAADQTLESSDGEIALQAGSFTPKPQIFSRAQWGANERMRDKGSLHYYEVHAGFVHHTVNANNYTKAQVPGIIRSIYAYHTQSKGWSDIGYNFLVDKFGRIWEGRYGGVDRPVVGAHTLGYNDYSFAMSAIGNYETAQPTSAMLNAYGKLFAWKLSLHGVSASSTRQKVGPKYFQAINGHRDAGSTACPGRYLYAKIPQIRRLAAQYQADWTGRERSTDVLGTAHPDILLRRSDGTGFVLPTGGMLRFRAARQATFTRWSRYDTVVVSPDLTGDAKSDLLVRDGTGARVRPGTGTGDFGNGIKPTQLFQGMDQVTAVGDLNGDGRNDLVARQPSTGRLFLYRGNGSGGFTRAGLSTAWASYTMTVGTGDVNGDGKADVLARDKAGALWLHRGTGRSTLAARVKVPGSFGQFDAITGFGDYTGDGKVDLVVRTASNGSSYVLPGRGNGSFGHSVGPFTQAKGLGIVAGGDVLGNKAPDVVGVRGNLLVSYSHYGAQNVRPMVSVGSAFQNASLLLNVGDWDRDGRDDVVTRTSSGTLELRRGLAGSKLAPPVSIASGFQNVTLIAAVGDTTGDGYPDLMGQPKGGSMRIYPGYGLHGLKASYVAHSAVSAGGQFGVGRYDGDGAPDNLFRSGSRLRMLRGNGPGGLTGASAAVSLDLTGYDRVLSPGDVDRDGRADLVVREKATGYLWLLPGRSGGGYGTRRFLAEGFTGYDLMG
ncbi:hypothetical protein EKO23_18270 [Nocardioides guangzhouensis]|uniref:Peptidoglycan recognition protein family domain-containing protein n=1 Tax=Nocardioides guangzhouensis TaxID=2497878 RepID=A0A4Q4Z7F4_9ACTN|nr:FG-GAP-like repeat-containing protein [Nocardioides guangzhouensis]RYP83703.1 hypothetical protein EKO23_18270 [Nocardioides guangzhouensis]